MLTQCEDVCRCLLMRLRTRRYLVIRTKVSEQMHTNTHGCAWTQTTHKCRSYVDIQMDRKLNFKFRLWPCGGAHLNPLSEKSWGKRCRRRSLISPATFFACREELANNQTNQKEDDGEKIRTWAENWICADCGNLKVTKRNKFQFRYSRLLIRNLIEHNSNPKWCDRVVIRKNHF